MVDNAHLIRARIAFLLDAGHDQPVLGLENQSHNFLPAWNLKLTMRPGMTFGGLCHRKFTPQTKIASARIILGVSHSRFSRFEHIRKWCSAGVPACELRRRLAAKSPKAPGRCLNSQPGQVAPRKKWKCFNSRRARGHPFPNPNGSRMSFVSGSSVWIDDQRHPFRSGGDDLRLVPHIILVQLLLHALLRTGEWS